MTTDSPGKIKQPFRIFISILLAMALTSAVANAAAAAVAGAGKKAAQVQLQAELNTDDEWAKFIARDGLLVVDVYTEWCGPCLGMVGNLKKIKVELGGDNLHLAVAKADTIECLKRFRKRSEPTWMFLAGGQLLKVVFGANAPLLARTIEEELRNELRVRTGELTRTPRAPHQLTPEEQEVATAQQQLEAERRAREAAAAEAARLARREARARRIEAYFADLCPVLLLPHAQKHLRKVSDALEAYGLNLADKCPVVLSAETARALAAEAAALAAAPVMAALLERPSTALLVRRQPAKEGDVIKLTLAALCGEGEEPAGAAARRPPADELRQHAVPGLCVPADRHQRAAILDLLFPKLVGSSVSPPPAAEPPRVAMMFGAWQRRAVLTLAAALEGRLLRYGFFENASVEEPKLLCKTLDQYELRTEKDYAETIVIAVAVGPAEPANAPPPADAAPPADCPAAAGGAPQSLLALGPLHVSEDAVLGEQECNAFFPPGYNQPEPKPKQKGKKKKKKRHETKEETVESATEAPAEPGDEAAGDEAAGDADARDSEPDNDADDDSEADRADHAAAVDKATSPPPLTPH